MATQVFAATFTVTTTSDTGGGSLRAAVQSANSTAGDDVINFAAGITTITLASEIVITNNGALTISGNGANILTIDGGPGTNRIFSISNAFVTISGVTLTGGNGTGASFSGSGGAIYAQNSTVVLDGVHVTLNSGTGDTTVNNVGGVYLNGGGNHRIINSTFSGNTTTGDCGAILTQVGFTVINSTFSNNHAGGGGGGVCINGGTSQFRNVTITKNSAARGSGIMVFSGTLNLGNTIVAENPAGTNSDIYNDGTIVSFGSNLIGNNSGVETVFPAGNPNANNERVGTSAAPLDPQHGSLILTNGATTPTHALLSGSPAIDKGNNALAVDTIFGNTLSTDQRGFARIVDSDGNGTAIVDIGAYEVQLAPTAATVSVSGRVTTITGRGIRSVQLFLTDSQGNIRTTTTSTFGYYHFDNVQVGETYILSASGKHYNFSQPSQVLNFNEETEQVNFIANSEKRLKVF
jgi:hypothetical protein